MRKIKYLIVKLIRLLFSYINGGDSCVVCGNITFVYPVCKKCRKKYFKIDESILSGRCEICGRELISTKNICMRCRNEPVLKSAGNVIPLFSYRLWNKELLFQWKIEGVRNLSFFFAGLVNKALYLLGYDIIVPVPPRKGKIKKKGWDQIQELCEILEIVYRHKVLNLLHRVSSGEQKKLNRSQRLETIKNAYEFVSPKELSKELQKNGGKLPEEVCLIDDVCTTGATIECSSSVLKIGGIKRVNVITLFTVD